MERLLAEKFSGTSVLVTGGAGFIGSHLTERLAGCGATVTVMDNLRAGLKANLDGVMPQLQWIEGDVRNAQEVAGVLDRVDPNWIFHLAANASVPGSVQDPVYDYETNASGTFVLLNALRERANKGICKVVVASSGAVYGEPQAFPIREDDSLNPISPYGASKLCAEVQSRVFSQVYQVPVVIARLFNTYGPRMARFVVLDFLRKLQDDPSHLEILGSGQQVRDFTYVSDTVQGLLLLALNGSAGAAYNVSSGRSYSVTDLAHELIAVCGLRDQTRITYTGQSWVGDAQRWEVSIEKLASLGYTSQVSLVAGLMETRNWFLSKRERGNALHSAQT